MESLKTVINTYNKLTTEWDKPSPNLEECETLLKNLKVKLIQTKLDFLPTEHSLVDNRQIILARSILEIGAQWAIAKEREDAFESYMAQLKTYYLDYRVDGLEESTYKYQLLGLNLLKLLSQNKLADFHTELELLSAKERQNLYIKHPIQLEQYLMEGRYNKVFMAQENIPAASYKFFMKKLLKTTRDEIARCIEKAYQKISYHEAARMMFVQDQADLEKCIVDRKWVHNQQDDMIYFQQEEKVEERVPAVDLAQQMISYAEDLEKIV